MIKLFEDFNEYSDIQNWLDDKGIKNYTINKDLSVDVEGNVNLWRQKVSTFPFKFGKVTGYFNCEDNGLRNLNGCPDYVGGNFNCSCNGLTTLLGSPKYIGESFYCGYNFLKTLQHFPIGVEEEIEIHENPLPQKILNFDTNKLKIFINNQEDYSVWNSDGSFNKQRFDMFMDDFKAGLLN